MAATGVDDLNRCERLLGINDDQTSRVRRYESRYSDCIRLQRHQTNYRMKLQARDLLIYRGDRM